MSPKVPREITPSHRGGIFQDIATRIKLILRLMGDARVNPLLKVLPIATLLYLIVPDLAPGPFDDAAVIWLGTTLFVELCPQDIVKEHIDALTNVVPSEWSDPSTDDDEIVDAEFRIDD